MKTRIIPALLAAVIFSVSLGVQAATIAFTVTDIQASPGSTIVLTVVGSGFNDDVDAGGFGATWDETVLDYTGTNVIDPPWDTNFLFETDVATGTLNAVFLGSSSNAGINFQVAEITFQVIGLPGTATTVQLGIDDFDSDWFAPGTVPYPGVVYGGVNVAVAPVPAAAWLFGSALGLLAWVRRSRVA